MDGYKKMLCWRVPSIWFYSYEILEKANPIYSDKVNQWLPRTRVILGFITEGHKGTVGVDRNILYLDYDGSYTILNVCENSLNCDWK